MPDKFYVVQRPAHVTFYNYLYRVPDGSTLAEVMDNEDPEYLGFTDGDWDDGPDDVIEGPFDTADAAARDSSFYIE